MPGLPIERPAQPGTSSENGEAPGAAVTLSSGGTVTSSNSSGASVRSRSSGHGERLV